MGYRLPICHFLIIYCLLLLGGCSEKDAVTGYPDGRMTYVSVKASVKDYAHGVLDSACTVSDLNIFAYHDGELEGHAYTEGQDYAGMNLERGKAYGIYVLANAGPVEPPVSESSLIKAEFAAEGMDELNCGPVPMSALANIIAKGTYFPVRVYLERMTAKFGIALKLKDTGCFTLETARVTGAPEKYRPFSEGFASDGLPAGLSYSYEAPQEAVSDLAAGRIWYFHTLENCQGVLFPGNDDSRKKSPDNLPSDIASSCTCLEITGTRRCISGVEKKVSYRLCLGKDALSDCSVVRNTYMKVSLEIFGDACDDFIWSTDGDTVAVPGLRFIACGSGGETVCTDSEGELNTAKVGDSAWRDIVSGEGIYVMVGDSGAVAFSMDGRTWEHSYAGDADWKSVAWGNGRFLAAGYSETAAPGGGKNLLTGYLAVSEDGKTWTLENMPGYRWSDIAYGEGRFVATGSIRKAGMSHSSGRFAWSDDGSRWTVEKAFSRDFPNLTYGKGMFVAIDGGTCVYSHDGSEWSSPEYSGFPNMDDIVYGAGRFVAVSRFGTVMSSDDGHQWTGVLEEDENWNKAAFSGEHFFICGSSGLLQVSRDGMAWSPVETGIALKSACQIR